ncbi:MAG: hypothetical protein L6R41_001829 [Letrouitia leprolyta]|nr:MAG: hypothetical protein L6R41_001829 [Letrouitia leprolyta]
MLFQVLPAEPSDIPEIAVIHHDAFAEDPIVGLLMPDVKPDLKNEYDLQYYKKTFANAHLTGSVMHKAVDTETGKIVAFAKWVYPYTLTPEQKTEKEKLDLSRSYPEGTNVELYEDFFKQLDAKRELYTNEEKDYWEENPRVTRPAHPPVLHILVVAPQYQRRGLGTLLIREGLAAADRDSAQTYVEASAKGLALYQRHGWEIMDSIKMDMTPHGGNGIAVEELMTRQPGTGIGGTTAAVS